MVIQWLLAARVGRWAGITPVERDAVSSQIGRLGVASTETARAALQRSLTARVFAHVDASFVDAEIMVIAVTIGPATGWTATVGATRPAAAIVQTVVGDVTTVAIETV